MAGHSMRPALLVRWRFGAGVLCLLWGCVRPVLSGRCRAQACVWPALASGGVRSCWDVLCGGRGRVFVTRAGLCSCRLRRARPRAIVLAEFPKSSRQSPRWRWGSEAGRAGPRAGVCRRALLAKRRRRTNAGTHPRQCTAASARRRPWALPGRPGCLCCRAVGTMSGAGEDSGVPAAAAAGRFRRLAACGELGQALWNCKVYAPEDPKKTLRALPVAFLYRLSERKTLIPPVAGRLGARVPDLAVTHAGRPDAWRPTASATRTMPF